MSDHDTVARKMDVGSPKPVPKSDLKYLLIKAKKSVPFFAKYFCNTILTAKQVGLIELLNGDSDFIGLFNRGGGKSIGFSLYDTHELMFRSYPSGLEDTINLYAPIKEQSNIIFTYVTKFIEKNKILYSRKKEYQKGGLWEFKNGNRLFVKTASPQSHPRGFHPTKIQCDETQDITDSKYYEEILPSGASKGAKVQEIGTPAGRNHFWYTYKDNDDYKRIKQIWTQCEYMMPGHCLECGHNFNMPTYQNEPFICPACGKTKKQYNYVMKRKRQLPPKKFAQEFECKWDTDTGMVWAYSLLNKMMVLDDMNILPIPAFQYFAGVDIAKSPAETVVSAGVLKGDELEQVSLKCISDRDSWTDITKEVYDDMIIYQPTTSIDATKGSQGNVVADDLVTMLNDNGFTNLSQRIFPEHYDNNLKNELSEQVDVLGSMGRLRLLNNERQRRQLIAYQQKVSEFGKVRFFSDKGTLSDIPQAVMLMVYAYLQHGGAGNQSFRYAMGKSIGMGNQDYTNPYLKQINGLQRPK